MTSARRLWVLLAVLAGCGTSVRSSVTVFHELNGGPSAFCLERLPEQRDSLEHAAYEKVVRQELGKRSFRETACDAADLVVMFTYGIDSGRAVVSSYPIYGQTGVSSSYTSGTVTSFGNVGTYSGTTTYTPKFGVVGSGTRTDVVFTRALMLNMFDRRGEAAPKKVYEATVASSGSCGQLSAVLPTMLRELFEDFPGRSGSTRQASRHLDT